MTEAFVAPLSFVTMDVAVYRYHSCFPCEVKVKFCY